MILMALLLSKNPFFLILSLFLMVLCMIFLIYQTLQTQWFSLLIFILFIGGLLIMFLYLISLVPKEKFKLNLWTPILFLPWALLQNSLIPPLSPLNSSQPFLIYSYTPLMIFTILFLLLTLLMATTLVKSKSGPLRLV